MPSFTEWFERIGCKKTTQFRQEDNSKRDRLEILYQKIGIPYDRPERMTVKDIVDHSPLFQDIIKRKGNEKCALRLIPLKPNLPKLRERGKTLNEYLNGWFKKLNLNPDDYKVEVVPHNDKTLYSLIFVITDKKAWGEILPGALWKLSTGVHQKQPSTFVFDFKKLKLTARNKKIKKTIKNALDYLHITNAKLRKQLKQKINAEFTFTNYLKGYYEFVVWPDYHSFFVDYNRLIPKIIKGLTGTCASTGTAKGKVRIVKNPNHTKFKTGEILVCLMTTVDYIPLMKKSAGIITEQGNLLSHAAIVSRELKKPCLVGVKNATKKLKNGNLIKIDADRGVIKIL